jgi:hypothetical protein
MRRGRVGIVMCWGWFWDWGDWVDGRVDGGICRADGGYIGVCGGYLVSDCIVSCSCILSPHV